MPATSTTSRSSAGFRGARSNSSGSTIFSVTSRCTVGADVSLVHGVPPDRFSLRTMSPRGCTGLIFRIVGNQSPRSASKTFRWLEVRAALVFRIASRSSARRPGLLPIRPRTRAERIPAAVISAISTRSRCTTAPSARSDNKCCGVVLSTGSCEPRIYAASTSSCSITASTRCHRACQGAALPAGRAVYGDSKVTL